MKIAITGKGGVGKSTLSALLGNLWAKEKTVTMVDADPSMNLALALGIPEETRRKIVPLSEMKDLIEERTGSNQWGFFKLNPKVDDLADKLSLSHNGMRLVVMGTITKGGGGCACSENVLLRAFLSHLLLEPQEVVIVDMEAGLEHLGRRTVQAVDAIIVVVEPGARSIDVGLRIKKLALDLGIKKIFFVANKVQTPEEISYIKEQLSAEELLGLFYTSSNISEADREGFSPYGNIDEQTSQVLLGLKNSLENLSK